MNQQSDQEKLDALTAQIHKAGGAPKATPVEGKIKPMKFSNVGMDFVGAVLVCAFLGWLADKTLGTKPWGLLIMIVIGFAVGIMNVWRALGAKTDE